MPVPSSIVDLSTTFSSNSPAGTDLIGNTLDEYLRALGGIIKQNASVGADLASASTITPPASGYYFNVTGTTTITTIASTNSWNGRLIFLEFAGILTLTQNASTLILPGGTSILTAAGDVGAFIQESSGVWRCVNYQVATNSVIAKGDLYTPIQVSTNTNVDSVTFFEGQYLRVGNVVNVSVQLSIDATATGDTVVRFSLPIASNLGSSYNVGGTGTQNGAVLLPSVVGSVYADATNDCAVFRINSPSTSAVAYLLHFTYRII